MEASRDILLSLGIIILLGISAQYIAWVLKFPSILFLLILGFLFGPILNIIDPDVLLGNLLMPFVSVSVALILFEGGLTLRLREFKKIGGVVSSLIFFGVVLTCIIVTLSAYYIIGLNLKISLILGAILVVTGPTVIGPLLREIRPYGNVADILKWEGIIIDPIGVLLAVLVFEAVLAEEIYAAGKIVIFIIGKTILFGFTIGIVVASLLILLLRKFLIPDYLQESVSFSMVIASYILSEYLQHESGLFATTIMGIVLANQKSVSIRHILEFKENLRIIIISLLFVILSARIHLDVFNLISFNIIIFLAVLILIARPLVVFISTIRSSLNLKEKLFISWMAPRGIVAAAVSSIFALRLSETDIPQAEYLLPVTFIVIVGTVAIYGLTAAPLSRELKLSEKDPQGIIIVGGQEWALEIAKILKGEGYRTVLIDTNRGHVIKARMENVETVYGSVLSENILNEISFNGLGRLLALTPNDEVNSLAALHLNHIFDKKELYQLPPMKSPKETSESYSPKDLRGRFLFGEGFDYYTLSRRYNEGSVIKLTKLTEKFDYAAFKAYYGKDIIQMIVIEEDHKMKIITADEEFKEPEPGHSILCMLNDPDPGPD